MEIKQVFSLFLLSLFVLSSVSFASGTGSANVQNLKDGICQIYDLVNQLLGVVIFVLVVLAGIVYAAGQVMDAQTRAKASVWATSMIVGAVIGIIIYVLVPTILGAMLGETNLQNSCNSAGSYAARSRIY